MYKPKKGAGVGQKAIGKKFQLSSFGERDALFTYTNELANKNIPFTKFAKKADRFIKTKKERQQKERSASKEHAQDQGADKQAP